MGWSNLPPNPPLSETRQSEQTSVFTKTIVQGTQRYAKGRIQELLYREMVGEEEERRRGWERKGSDPERGVSSQP